MSIFDDTDWLETVEKMSPEQIDRAIDRVNRQQASTPRAPRLSAITVAPPKFRISFSRLNRWYCSLSYWDKKSVESDIMLIGFLAAIPLVFAIPYLSVYGFPGQYQGAYQWADAQEVPTKINFCQRFDFGVKRCSFSRKNNGSGYIQSDNGSDWQDILDD